MRDSLVQVVEDDALRPMSGDGTVPYYSLSWCFHWLGKVANITYTPTQSAKYDKSGASAKKKRGFPGSIGPIGKSGRERKVRFAGGGDGNPS